MINTTPYTTKQLREYIKWVKWKYQPNSHWERDISEIFIEPFYDPHKKIEYDSIKVVLKNGITDVTIPLNRFRTFIVFHYIEKPKIFKLHGKE